MLEPVTRDLESLTVFEIPYWGRCNIEGKQMIVPKHAGHRLEFLTPGKENGRNNPNAERQIVNSALGCPTIDSFVLGSPVAFPSL